MSSFLVRKLREIINSEELCSIKNTVAASSRPSCNVVLGKLEETPTSEVADCVVHGELIVGENAVVKGVVVPLNVRLEVGEGARVILCSFPRLAAACDIAGDLDNNADPLCIKVEKGCFFWGSVFDMQSLENPQQVHIISGPETTIIDSMVTIPNILGARSFVLSSELNIWKHLYARDEERRKKTQGTCNTTDDVIIILASMTLGAMRIGNGFCVASMKYINPTYRQQLLSLIAGYAEDGIMLNFPSPHLTGKQEIWVKIRLGDPRDDTINTSSTYTIGKNAVIAASMSIQATDSVRIGDNFKWVRHETLRVADPNTGYGLTCRDLQIGNNCTYVVAARSNGANPNYSNKPFTAMSCVRMEDNSAIIQSIRNITPKDTTYVAPWGTTTGI